MQHEHDCDTCISLGEFKNYDLYFHPPRNGSPWTLVGRFGPHGDYQSASHITKVECLVEARKRAVAQGLMKMDDE